MKTFVIILFLAKSVFAENIISNYRNYPISSINYELTKVTKSLLNSPWGITFIDNSNVIVTEKNGRLLKINVHSGKINEISHEIESIKYRNDIAFQQGGLLDVYAHNDGYIYFSYSHDFKKQDSQMVGSSTAIAKGKLYNDKLKNFEILLSAEPKLKRNLHWGSRILIKNDKIYASFGERGLGMIAQDPTKHPGSIIRINTDGSIPNDNPAFKGYSDWLPEIYLIGVRNPQGITVSPSDGNIYFSQHGPKGGDNIGKVEYAANFGWKDIAWGGTEYSGKKIGTAPFKKNYNKPIISWVPSIAVGNINFYEGNEFSDWNGDLLVCATNTEMLIRLDFENNKIVGKEIIFENKIGRIRDFEIDKDGNIFIIVDGKETSLWKMTKVN